MPRETAKIIFSFLILFGVHAILDGQEKDLYALDHIVEIEIDFEDPNWQRKLTTYKEQRRDKRLKADLTLDGQTYAGVGVRYKGNSSLYAVLNSDGQKLPFNIKIDYKDSTRTLPGGYTRLKLSNVFRDPSYLREALSYEIAQQYMNAPRANFARVTVNGDYLGLYNLTQSVDEDMLAQFFGDRDGVLFKCDPDWKKEVAVGCNKEKRATLQYLGDDTACYLDKYELKTDSEDGWRALAAFTKKLEQEPEAIHNVLDVDEVLWMLAYDNVLVNLDSYIGLLCHNYYLYQDTFNIWHPVVWDMNMSLGGFRHTGQGSSLDNEELQTMSPLLHLREREKRRPLILKLLSQPLYRKIYVAHARTIYEDWLAEKQYKELAEQIRTTIRPLIEDQPHALYPAELFDQNYENTVNLGIEDLEIVGVSELLDGRAEYLSNHPLIQAAAPDISEPQVSVDGDIVTITASVSTLEDEEIKAVYLFRRAAQFHPWQRLKMEMSENGSYTVQMPLETISDYYLVAEGRLTASVLPRRSGRETFTLDINRK
ncbi:MAG: CotH kinase family protein [Bacteroidota bacterium]